MTAYVVQAVSGTAVTANGTITLGTTTAGNTLIAMASVRNSGTANATLANVTLGGVQDNFTHLQDFGTNSSAGGHLYWWLDALCAGGQTSVVYSTTGGNGTEALTMAVLEVGGLIPLTPGSPDTSSGVAGTASSASWNSGTTTLTSWPTEIWTGVVVSGTTTVTGPSNPWINLAAVGNGTVSTTMFGYQITPTAGSASFSGTFSTSQTSTAGAVTLPGLVTAPFLPGYVAGSGYQEGDASTLITSPLGFGQQRTIFRASQLTTTTTLPSGSPGTNTRIPFDTILEDPYQGWNSGTSQWFAPFTGWYHYIWTISVGTSPADAVLESEFSGLIMPTTGGTFQTTIYVYLIAGTGFGALARVYSGSNISTANSPPSTMEVYWLGFSAS